MRLSMKDVSDSTTYCGNSEISFFVDDSKSLAVTIDTQRLHMESIRCTDEIVTSYIELFSDSRVMKMFSDECVRSSEITKATIENVWASRWRNHDPYCGFAVFNRDTDAFLGHVALDHSARPGESDLVYLFHKEHWRKGFGFEAVSCLVTEYAQATLAENYTIKDVPLSRINATVREENGASIRILEKIGLKKVSEDEKYGTKRFNYSIAVHDIPVNSPLFRA